MASADAPYGFRPFYDDAPITMWPVAATETFATGDAVIITTGGVAIGLTDSANLLGVAAGPCASLATGTYVPIWCHPETLFVGRSNGTDALVAGDECDIIGATGEMELDSDGTSYNQVKLWTEVDTGESDAIGKEWTFRINKHLLAVID